MENDSWIYLNIRIIFYHDVLENKAGGLNYQDGCLW